MTTSEHRFDLVVIGSGPAGQKGAIAAAKLGKRVAIVDRREMIGGVSLHTGTIPSKTLREAVLYLTGYRQRAFYGPGAGRVVCNLLFKNSAARDWEEFRANG